MIYVTQTLMYQVSQKGYLSSGEAAEKSNSIARGRLAARKAWVSV